MFSLGDLIKPNPECKWNEDQVIETIQKKLGPPPWKISAVTTTFLGQCIRIEGFSAQPKIAQVSWMIAKRFILFKLPEKKNHISFL